MTQTRLLNTSPRSKRHTFFQRLFGGRTSVLHINLFFRLHGTIFVLSPKILPPVSIRAGVLVNDTFSFLDRRILLCLFIWVGGYGKVPHAYYLLHYNPIRVLLFFVIFYSSLFLLQTERKESFSFFFSLVRCCLGLNESNVSFHKHSGSGIFKRQGKVWIGVWFLVALMRDLSFFHL